MSLDNAGGYWDERKNAKFLGNSNSDKVEIPLSSS
jgi:hypothetical protein